MHRVNGVSSSMIILAGAFALIAPASSPVFAAEQRSLTVRESAGIRRFGYPVSVVIEFDPPVQGTPRFRLMEGDRPVTAQFRTTGHIGDRCAQVTLDFDSSFLPFETKHYTILWGDDEKAGPEPERGMTVTKNDRSYTISNQTFLHWSLDEDLSSLVRSVKTPELEYLEPNSAGLYLVTREGTRHQIGGKEDHRVVMRSTIVRQGPIACALHASGEAVLDPDKAKISVDVDLEFPRSKSWIRVDYRIEDPRDLIAELGCALNLLITGTPTLVDFGASSMVYATLRGDQQTVFRATKFSMGGDADSDKEPGWKILLGQPGNLELYAICPPASRHPPEGWAHVMDDKRCTAVAIADFAKSSGDRMEVDAKGRLLVARTFDSGQSSTRNPRKAFTCWFHFVPMPVHVGAATSPQSMQQPLEVKVGRPLNAKK